MRIYPRKNKAAHDHRRRSVEAGLFSLCALHEEIPRDRVMSHPMENERWSDGRLARPARPRACASRAGTPGAPLAISVTFVRLPTLLLLKRRLESTTRAFEGVRYIYVQLLLARICCVLDDYPHGRSRLQCQRPCRCRRPQPC